MRKSLSSPRGRFAAAVVLLVLVALGIRAWNLTAAGVWHDEALSHYYALQDPAWILEHSAGKINHPPLFFLLLHGWLKLVPAYQQAAIEALNLIVALAGLGIFARWMSRVFSRPRALVLTGLLAVHPFHVHYSTELRMYPLALTGIITAGYFATLLFHANMSGRWRWTGWVLASLVSLYTHSFTGLYVGLMTLFLLARAWREERTASAGTAVAVLLVLYGPWFAFVVRQATRISGDYWITAFHAEQLLILAYRWAGYVGPKSPGGVTLLKSLLACLGFFAPMIWSLRQRDPLARLSWLLVAGPVVVITLISLRGQSVFLYRSFLFGLPFAMVLVGYGAARLPAGRLALVLLAGLLVWETHGLKNHPPFRHLKTMAATLERAAGKRPTFHLATHSYYPALFYRRHRGSDLLIGRDKVTGRTLGRARFWEASRRRSVLAVIPRGHRPVFRRKLTARRRIRVLHRATRRGRYDVIEVEPPREERSDP